MISFNIVDYHIMQLDDFFCYKDIGNKAFFTMAALLMPLLENVENSTRSITLLLIGIVTLYTMCMPR